ncbi:MAG: phosphocarrier protein HPr [Clostridiales bacterium]|nr:phosphocarrier protein HPr [Clostridiales bacterium]
MITKKMEVTNALGLHARPASLLVKSASKFKSDIQMSLNGKQGSLKSIISVLSFSAKKGDVVEITTTGEDEEEAMKALAALFESNFGE